MLELMFNSSFWWGLLIAVIVVVIIWVCGKYPGARVFVLTGMSVVIGIVLLGTSIYCGVNLNAYYNEKGGVIGAITGIFETNTAEVVDEMNFKINDVELVQQSGNVYTATIMIDKVLNFDEDKQYGIYINENFVDNIENDEYAHADYTYTFQNNELTNLMTDTLSLDFAFNNNYTNLLLTTHGGNSAVSYWNAYFNKNSFIITIKESEYFQLPELSFGEGEVEEYYKVDYYFLDNLLFSKLYSAGSTIDLPNIILAESWKIERELPGLPVGEEDSTYYVTIDETYVVNEDISVYAAVEDYMFQSHPHFDIGNERFFFSNDARYGKGILKYNAINKTYEYLTFNNYWNYQARFNDANKITFAYILRADNGSYWYLSNYTFEMIDLTDATFAKFENYKTLYNNKIIYSNSSGGIYLYDIFTDQSTKVYNSGVWNTFNETFDEYSGKYTKLEIYSSEDYGYYLEYLIDSNTFYEVEEGSVGV